MKKENTKEQLKREAKAALISFGLINVAIVLGASVAVDGDPLLMLKSIPRMRLVKNYSLSEDDNNITCDNKGSITGLDIVTTYNSYEIEKKCDELIAVYKCTDGSIDRYDMEDYLIGEYDQDSYYVGSISSNPNRVLVYGVFSK